MSAQGNSVPGLIIRIAVLTLRADHRDRYRAELLAELYFLARRQRFMHAARVLSRTWALRAALSTQPDAIGDPLMTTKPLRCRLGSHHWKRQQNEEDGTLFMECTRCHDTRGLREHLPGIVGG
jgi:hypothetical protein